MNHPSTVIPKRDSVEAMRYTGKNAHEFCRWLRVDEYERREGRLSFRLGLELRDVWVGEWVVALGDPDPLLVLPNDYFHTLYREAK